MTDPQQSCPRCHLYLSARGCTPERCANPEGAAELERLTREEALAGPGVTKGRVLPPNDLADFCLLLGRMGCSYERGKTRTGWYVRTDEGYFFFDAASGRFRTNGIDPAERAEFDKWIARRDADIPVNAVVRKQGPQSDLDTFRAMLERAGVRFVLEPAKGPERRDPLFGDALTIRRAETNGDVDAMVSFVFNQKTGALMSVGIWGDE